MKNYIGFARDHSGSMSNIARAAARDYNATITSVRDSSLKENQDTIVSVVELGYGSTQQCRHVVTNSHVSTLQPIAESEYSARGSGTPLFDAVGLLIEEFRAKPDATDPNVSFLIFVTTDGQENASKKWSGHRLAEVIRELQGTDRWTFVFRVPRGYSRELTRFGIHEGNILEWDQSQRGVEVAAAATTQAFTNYFTARSAGERSVKTFYTTTANVTEADVKKLGDISAEVTLFPVAAKEDGEQIRDFVEKRLAGKSMLKGAAFYQLVKTEDKVQDYKLIAIRDKDSGAIYCGPEARDLIGLPRVGDARVRPDTAGKWQVFVQSTSVNRKVNGGTSVLYWPNVGVRFTEGKSAR
jgi:hypothetical protein